VLIEGGNDCVVTMDADFSHDPAAVPALIAAAADHDLVIGSRYTKGGYARLITRTPIRDLTSGFSCMRTAIGFVERRLGRSTKSSNIVYERLVEPWQISRRGSDGSPRG